jgi:hypothetical protein
MAASMVIAEPLFFGQKKKAPGMISAEDFIRRVDTMQASQTWNDRKAADMAIGFLREDAAKWLEETCTALMTTRQVREMKLSYIDFKKVFKKKFFYITTQKDMACDWGTLKQTKEETATDFIERVAGNLVKYANLQPPVREADLEEFTAYTAALTAFSPEATNEMKTALNAASDVFIQALQRKSAHTFALGITAKVAAEGCLQTKIAEIIRIEDANDTPLTEILDKVDRVEKAFKLSNNNKKNHGVHAIDNGESREHAEAGPLHEDAQLDAVGGAGQRGRGRGRGRGQARGGQGGQQRGRGGQQRGAPRGGNTQRATQPPSNAVTGNFGPPRLLAQQQQGGGQQQRPQGGPNRGCWNCGRMDHWIADCPTRPQMPPQLFGTQQFRPVTAVELPTQTQGLPPPGRYTIQDAPNSQQHLEWNAGEMSGN